MTDGQSWDHAYQVWFIHTSIPVLVYNSSEVTPSVHHTYQRYGVNVRTAGPPHPPVFLVLDERRVSSKGCTGRCSWVRVLSVIRGW